jgi:hypothetical protein
MKVYANAFELKSTDALKIPEFFANLEREAFVRIEHSNRGRVLAVGSRDGLFCGILISAREQTSFITIEEDSRGNPVVHVQHTADGLPMADVNFFIVKESSACGVFSTYHGAGGLVAFGNLLGKLYRKQAVTKGATVLAEASESGEELSDKNRRQIEAVYRKARLELRQ